MIPARLLHGTHVLPLATFFGAFAWSFVHVSLPFHIQRISTWDASATLHWTGWILGISLTAVRRSARAHVPAVAR